MSRIARSVVDVMLGEGGGATPEQRYEDYLGIASVISNRQSLTKRPADSIVSATRNGKKQFSAYGKQLPPGVERYRAIAEKALKEVQENGPVHNATYYATPERVGRLPGGLKDVTRTKSHVYKVDPQNRAILTADGYVSVRGIAGDLKQLASGVVNTAGKAMQAIGIGPGQKGGPSKRGPQSANGVAPGGMVDSFRARLSSVNFDAFPLDPATKAKAKEFQQAAVEQGIADDLAVDVKDMTRTPERQQQIKDAGYSKTLTSEHMYGAALDVSPVDVNDQKGWAAKRELASSLGWSQLGSWDPAHMGLTPDGLSKQQAYKDFQYFGSVPALMADATPTPTTRPDLVPPGMEVARAPLDPVQPIGAVETMPVAASTETVQPSAPEKVSPSLGDLLNPVSSAYAEPAPTPEKTPAEQALEHLVGTEPVQSDFPARPEAVGGNTFTPGNLAANYARNKQYTKPGLTTSDFQTKLSPEKEQAFRSWVKDNNIPFDPDVKTQDYDMRGFWSGMMAGDPHATSGIDPNDGNLHFTDYYKTPFHETFSAQSKFATATAPDWQGDQLVDKQGNVVYDDTAHMSEFAARPGVVAPNKTPDEALAPSFPARPEVVSDNLTQSLRVGGIQPLKADTASLVPPADVINPFSYVPETVQPDNLPNSINDQGLNRVQPAQPAQPAVQPGFAVDIVDPLAQPAGSVIRPDETIAGTTPADVTDPNSVLTAAPVTAPKSPITKAPPLSPPKTVRTIPVAEVKAASPAAPAKPSVPSLSPNDVLSGAIGQATASDGNVVSRDAYGRTAVTNKYGATTVTLPDGRQAASSQKGPLSKKSISGSFVDDLTKDIGKNMPSRHEIGGSLLGGLIGAMLGGPGGAAVGAALGRKAGTLGPLNDLFPDAPPNPTGATKGSNRTHDQMRDISPAATSDIERGVAGLF